MQNQRYVSILPSGLINQPTDVITAYIAGWDKIGNQPMYNRTSGERMIPCPALDVWSGTIAEERPIRDPRITQLISQIQSDAARAAITAWASSDSNNAYTAHNIAARTVTDAILAGHSGDAVPLYNILMISGYRPIALRIGVIYDQLLRIGQTRTKTPLYILSPNYVHYIGVNALTPAQYLDRIYRVMYQDANISLDANSTITGLIPVTENNNGRVWEQYSIVVETVERPKTDEDLHKIALDAMTKIRSSMILRSIYNDCATLILRRELDTAQINALIDGTPTPAQAQPAPTQAQPAQPTPTPTKPAK